MTDPTDLPPPARDVYADPVPDPAPEPAHETALHEVLWFLEECRNRGYQVGPYVKHGNTVIQVRDLRQAAREGDTSNHDDGDIWVDHGHGGRE